MRATIRFPLGILVVALVLACAGSSTFAADDAYYAIPLAKLTVTEGAIPQDVHVEVTSSKSGDELRAYAAADDASVECLVATGQDGAAGPTLYLRAGAAVREIAGTLFLPDPDGKSMQRVRFKSSTQSFNVAAEKFLHVKLEYYRRLCDEQVPGGAWFRYQARMLEKQLGEKPDANRVGWRAPAAAGVNQDELDDLVGLLSGGRAISENLQLDRVLPPSTQPAEETVKLDTLPGITVSEFDWSALTKDLKPQLDPLASLIPADQHAVFFPSFDSATKLVDQAQKRGSLFLMAAEERTEDAMTQQRYEKQLCLPLGELGRLIGPQLINSVAVTGSDPYLRVGSDVAVLFETKNGERGEVLAKLLAARRTAMAGTSAKHISGQVSGVEYSGDVTRDRAICAYQTSIGNCVIVTNSLFQLRRIIETKQGTTPAIASLPEYIFFRDRYKRDDASESAFLILSDATIRRWCGPKWRIADSRRTRAAAMLSELQAEHAERIVEGVRDVTTIKPDLTVPQMDEVTLTPTGVLSSTYGALDFMTPISELDITNVTKSEASSYARWRDSYQQNWRWFFDPIACRFSIDDNKIGVDVTVMPLIAASEYRDFVKITSGASLKPTSGDPHPEAIAHLAFAINPDSDTIRGYGKLLQNLSGNLRIEPLAWLGSSVAIYADDDPFWDELAKAEETDEFMEKNYQRLPVALYAESRDGLRLAAFVTALRAFVEQSAPGTTKWENVTHGDKTYVKVTASENGNAPGNDPSLSLFYATTPKALIVSLSEPVLQRAMDRQSPPTTQTATGATTLATAKIKSWLAKNIGLRIEPRLTQVLVASGREDLQAAAHHHAWANLPILNEWKRLFPGKDPMAIHQRLFSARLIDPAGGAYTWNDQWHTMESANYGHPGEPKAGPAIDASLSRLSGNFGLTFENKGVRARAEVQDNSTDK